VEEREDGKEMRLSLISTPISLRKRDCVVGPLRMRGEKKIVE